MRPWELLRGGRCSLAVVLCWTTLVISSLAAAADSDPSLTFFRDLAETRNYTLGEPVAPSFTADGKAVVFLRGGARDPVLRLYELDLASGRERELASPERLLGQSAEALPAEERARRERARISTRGFTAFELSRDGSHVLVTLSGRLYVIERASLTARELPGQDWLVPHLSPDGRFVAAVSQHELYVIDAASGEAHAVTTGASATLQHGLAEFVAQEEMARRDGYWWSPDGRALVYQENDESAVEVRYIADPLHPERKPDARFYPRAGTANTRVRLGIVAREGGSTRWIRWDAERYPYVARVSWAEPHGRLTVLVQNRTQQEQLLLAVDPESGATQEILRESDAAWLELDEAATPMWLPDGLHFLWTTERTGSWQVELRDAAGHFVRFVTPPGAGYRRLLAADAQFAFVAAAADAREIQLWRFALTGGAAHPLSSGAGHHAAVFSRDRQLYVHSYELLDGRIGWEVQSVRSGRRVAELRSVAESPPVRPRVELLRTSGERVFDAAIVRPQTFAPDRKYPVILSVYAGPTVKYVNATSRPYLTDQWMADQGYVVVRIDGRGTPWHGRAWSRAVRDDLIDVPLADQVAGLQALAAHYPELDLSRVGVTGWSFGGYFSAMATLRRPDIFKAGVAGAPVVTWENYDTHYTERYLGLPQDNPSAYRVSDVTSYAEKLQRPLLIIHGLTDDNVYAQHSLQLCDALFAAGKTYEFMPMLGTHMISEPAVRLQQQRRIMEFFRRNLQ